MSVNDFIRDVREACAAAHACARLGDLQGEASAWLDVGAYALARAEVVQQILDSERGAASTSD